MLTHYYLVQKDYKIQKDTINYAIGDWNPRDCNVKGVQGLVETETPPGQ